MYYINHPITNDLFWPSLVQKRPEALWAFSASVDSFLPLMSNPLAFDFLLPLMYLPNDFLLLAMLLPVKFYLLYWLFRVCLRLLLLGGTSAHTPWKPGLLSLCFLFMSSRFSPIGCFLPFLDFFWDGIIWDRSSRNSQLPQRGEGLSMAWGWQGEMERGRGLWEWRS